MFWKSILTLFASGGGLFASQTHPDNGPLPPSLDERRGYTCARELGALLPPEEQTGPIFSEADLVFTSVDASNGTQMLVVSVGQGLYGVPLRKTGVNRIRFELGAKLFYLSYMHGAHSRARVFEFSVKVPPPGHDELEYQPAVVFRSPMLLPSFEYAIHETVGALLAAVTDGRSPRANLKLQNRATCTYMSARVPALAAAISHTLTTLDLLTERISVPVTPRLPASEAIRTKAVSRPLPRLLGR